jgi:hypothetical protein
VFVFDLFIVFIVFFVFILVPRHKSRESVKIGPHPRGHPSSPPDEESLVRMKTKSVTPGAITRP